MSSANAYAALSARMGGGSGLYTGWIGLPDPLLAGIAAREDLDAVTMDMQHGTVDVTAAVQGIEAGIRGDIGVRSLQELHSALGEAGR